MTVGQDLHKGGGGAGGATIRHDQTEDGTHVGNTMNYLL